MINNNIFTAKDINIRTIWIYYSEIISNQDKIDFNKRQNEIRWSIFNICLWLTISIPIGLVFVYILLNLFIC
jgi:hypothetical protein